MFYSSAKQMERLDGLAVNHGLSIRQMMELAGWRMRAVFRAFHIPRDARVCVVCGKGNKAGDGLAAARHLINYGQAVDVILLSREMSEDAAHQLRLLEEMRVPITLYNDDTARAQEQIDTSEILIDALIGYHLDGDPRGTFADVIRMMNESDAITIAYDIPSGLDATDGTRLNPCIVAEATLTLALVKNGLVHGDGPRVAGRIYLADIGIPAFLYDKIEAGSRPEFQKGVVPITAHP
jgi:NAD(P)H-hydrate epimerase